MFVSTNTLIGLASCIFLTYIIYIVAKNVTYKIIKNETGVSDSVVKRMIDNEDEHYKFFKNAKYILIGSWIIVIVIVFLFFGSGVKKKDHDMGAIQTMQEAKEFVPPTKEVIEETNKIGLTEKEDAIEKEVEEDQKKSQDEYEEFLKKSLENVNKN